MDTSKEYIKMCEMSKEIQDLHKPMQGDFWCCSCQSCQDNKDLKVWIINDYEIDYINQRDLTNVDKTYANMVRMAEHCFGGFWVTKHQGEDRGYTWLLRQDQLSDIIDTWNKKYSTAFFENIVSNSEYRSIKRIGFNSIEKHLLVFIMNEKFKKTWNGKEWTK